MSRPRAANQRCAIHPVHAFHFRRNVGCEWRAGSSARHTFRHIRGRHHSSAVSQWAGGVGASGHVLRWGRRCRELLCTWPHHGPGGTVAVGRSAPSPRAAGGAFAIGLRLPRALGAVPAELPARALRALSPRALWALSPRALWALSPRALWALSPRALWALSPRALWALSPRALWALSPRALWALSPRALWALSPRALWALSPRALWAISPRALWALSPRALWALSPRALWALSPRALRALSARAVGALGFPDIKLLSCSRRWAQSVLARCARRAPT